MNSPQKREPNRDSNATRRQIADVQNSLISFPSTTSIRIPRYSGLIFSFHSTSLDQKDKIFIETTERTMSIYLHNLDISMLHRNTRSNEAKFPIKLHQMLQEVRQQGKAHIVSWHPDGRSFRVHDQAKFVELVLPHYFSQTQYRSFQRQLNHYRFERIVEGPFVGFYHHCCFLRDNKKLCQEMKRESQKKTSSSLKTSKSWNLPTTSNPVSRSNSISSTSGPGFVVSRSNSIFSDSTASRTTLSESCLIGEDTLEIETENVGSLSLRTDPFEDLCDRLFKDTLPKDQFSSQQSLQDANRLFLTENPLLAPCDSDLQ
jgi:hypothetical protein